MSEQIPAEPAPPPSLLAGFFILLIVIVGIVGWIVLGSTAKLTSFYASFLFLWYWSTVDHLDFKKFFFSMIGAMIGIGLAWGLHTLPTAMGTNGIILSLVLVVVAVYLVIIERLKFAFNPALTLYLTVVAAPALLENSNFGELALATLLGGAFFGLFVFIVLFIVSKVQSNPNAANS